VPRANRYFLPGLVWHLTHRCHKRSFLFKFARDRANYVHWLYEARRRHGLCVLDYMVTCNHVHLLVKDTGEGVISRSMQLVASRTAQQYNQRKARQGAFWEDRYHATAIEASDHLHRCLAYIDLNMVRAGVVTHPVQWEHSGYREIQTPPKRYRVVDLEALSETCGFASEVDLRGAHQEWVQAQLLTDSNVREERWSDAIAVGSEAFVRRVKDELGLKALHRSVGEINGRYVLHETREPYTPFFDPQNRLPSPNNTVPWRFFS
jgi:putative transposase